MKRLFLMAFMIMMVFVGVVSAYPTLDTFIPSEPAIGPSGVDYVLLTDVTTRKTSTSVLVLELAGFESAFGIYNPSDPSKTLQLFAGGPGGAEPGVSTFTLMEYDPATGYTTITGSHDPSLVGNSAQIGKSFGFYLDANNNPANRYLTDGTLNPDGDDHGLIYAPEGSPYVYVAFEDLPDLGDEDWNDFVVRVGDVAPVPVPTSLLLGSIGVAFVGWLRNRKI